MAVDDEDNISMGTGIEAAVRVALINTLNTLIHPIHAVKVLLGIEHEDSIAEQILTEQKRIIRRRRSRSPRNG